MPPQEFEMCGAAPPLNYRLALWTDLAVGANGPPIH